MDLFKVIAVILLIAGFAGYLLFTPILEGFERKKKVSAEVLEAITMVSNVVVGLGMMTLGARSVSSIPQMFTGGVILLVIGGTAIGGTILALIMNKLQQRKVRRAATT